MCASRIFSLVSLSTRRRWRTVHVPGNRGALDQRGVRRLHWGLSSTAVLGRRYQLNDVVSWQKGLHHMRFGGDWETSRGGRTSFGDEPVTMNLFSPQTVRDFNSQQPPDSQIPLPATFLTLPGNLAVAASEFHLWYRRSLCSPGGIRKSSGFPARSLVLPGHMAPAPTIRSRLRPRLGL